MVVNDYEKTYASVYDAVNDTKHLMAVVDFLRQQTKPVTCAEIGKAVFGECYCHEYTDNSLSSRMGQMLRHLRKGGFIKVEMIDGAPVQVSSWGWVEPVDAPPKRIKVHDDEGHEYWIPNPKYDYRCHSGDYKEIKKTIISKIKVYYWVGE